MRISNLRRQSGQSVVEALVLLLVLILMFMAIPWLGRISDIGLQQSSASRYAAFQLTRDANTLIENDIKARFFLQPEHQWKDRANKQITEREHIHVSVTRNKKLNTDAQPGGDGSHQLKLRREWEIEDQGIANVSIDTRPQYTQVDDRTNEPMSPSLSFFDQQIINIHRHTAILTDTAHSSSDLYAHQRSAQRQLAWSEATTASYESGQKIRDIASPVDAAWSRPEPVFDWIKPWAGQLPQHHLGTKRGH